MVDAVHAIYLWHGWWPQSDEDSESKASTTGSAETRWSNDRRLAMETIKSYAEGISCCTLTLGATISRDGGRTESFGTGWGGEFLVALE